MQYNVTNIGGEHSLFYKLLLIEEPSQPAISRFLSLEWHIIGRHHVYYLDYKDVIFNLYIINYIKNVNISKYF